MRPPSPPERPRSDTTLRAPQQYVPPAEPRPTGPAAPRGSVWLHGLHPVEAALANPARRLKRLLLTEEAEAALAAKLPQPWPLQPERIERAKLDHLLGRDTVHQGAGLLADLLPPPALSAVLDRPGPVLVLDQVTDPRNVGAILRSAAAFGVAGIITQDRNSPEETGVMAKAASGALERVPLLRAVNLARTLAALKAAGLWVVGLDSSGPPLRGTALAERRVALVLGAEGCRAAPPHPGHLRRTRGAGDAGRHGEPERLRRGHRGAVRVGPGTMTDGSPGQAASLLLAARRGTRRLLDRLPDGVHPTTMQEGIAAQVALAGLQGAARPAGFKIGATAQSMRDYLGLAGPAAGFMTSAGLHASGSTLSFSGFLRPGVECELAVHLAHDLSPGPCTPEQAAAAVDRVMAAIEIVENRYTDLAAFGAPAMIADQVFHAAAVLGQPDPHWRALNLEGVHGHITVNGTRRGEGFGRDLLGSPMQALAWLAGSAEAAAYGGLRAGQVIMLGSVCPPVWLDGPSRIDVTFAPLEPVFLNLV